MVISESDISSYLEFLIKERHLYVSLHGAISKFSSLTRYNFHMHPYCRFVKTVCSGWNECIRRQKKVIDACSKGEFFGTCYAGVSEFVYPLNCRNEVFGFISVSGFKSNDQTSVIKRNSFAARFAAGNGDIHSQSELLDFPPDKQQIDAVIRPLVLMCEVFYENNLSDLPYSNTGMSSVIQYVNEFHTSDLTVATISEHFKMSASSISHKFKKITGYSLADYIKNLRINDAMWLLTRTEKSATEIAALLGFCSSAYFSGVFRKITGLTPSDFRKHCAK